MTTYRKYLASHLAGRPEVPLLWAVWVAIAALVVGRPGSPAPPRSSRIIGRQRRPAQAVSLPRGRLPAAYGTHTVTRTEATIPSGEDPFGHISETVPGDGKYRARVVCLQVVTDTSGVMRAGIGAEITESSSNTLPAGLFVRWAVRDTGLPGGEGDGFRRLGTTSIPILACPPPIFIQNLEHGNINIHDA